MKAEIKNMFSTKNSFHINRCKILRKESFLNDMNMNCSDHNYTTENLKQKY